MTAPRFMPRPDDQEFGDCLHRAASRLRAFAVRLCRVGTTVEAEDVVQAALERAWRYRAACEASGSLEGWLLRTAFRAFLDLRRGAERAPAAADDVVRAAVRKTACPVEVRDEIEHVLAGLRAIERSLLLEFHRDGLSIDELARRHALPINTVKSHLHRARRRLAGKDKS